MSVHKPVFKPKGTRFWHISISDRSGKQIRKSSGTTDEAAAIEYAERERVRIWNLKVLGDGGSHTLREAVKRWLSETEKDTKDRDEARLGWFLAQKDLPDAPISTINIDVVNVLRKIGLEEEDWSKGNVNRYMATLRAMLRKAMKEWKWLQAAPFVPMYSMKNQPDAVWLTRSQVERLLKELRPTAPHLALAVEFALATGLRMRAQSGLTWERVDLRAKRAWVPKSGQKAGYNFGLPLNRDALLILRKLKTLNPTGEHVFQYKPAHLDEAQPIDDFNTAAFQKACVRAGLPEGVNWHSLRHTWATWAAQSGKVTLHDLMGLGDWRSYEMVQKYSHHCPDRLLEAANHISRKLHRPSKRKVAARR